jgi:hypothetical protein
VKQSILCVLLVLLVAMPARAQVDTAEAWRRFAQTLAAGSEVRLRLQSGQSFKATLIEARADAMILQPKTRRPVPVQLVPYDTVTSIERTRKGGMSAARAAAIGVGAGAGAFLAFMLIVIASYAD